MSFLNGPYRLGALFIAISAALHVFAFIVGGFSADALRLTPVGLVYALLAFGLTRGWRWLAYVAFIAMMIGGTVALGSLWAPSPVPQWWTLAIIAADWLAAAALFAALWRPARKTHATSING